jgi:hypothetical protein
VALSGLFGCGNAHVVTRAKKVGFHKIMQTTVLIHASVRIDWESTAESRYLRRRLFLGFISIYARRETVVLIGISDNDLGWF